MLHRARKLNRNLQSQGISCKERLNQKYKLLRTKRWIPVQSESRSRKTATSCWPLKFLNIKNKHGCALPKAFFQLFSLCPGMLQLIKWLIPITEHCMLQDQNPQESTSLTFFPYPSHFYASL